MNVDYTGRQIDITPKIRKEVETGLAKLAKIVGENCSCKVILTAEKQRRIVVEITLTKRLKKLVGIGESTDVLAAIDEALNHIEKQALKLNTRKRDVKRAAPPTWKRGVSETPEAPETELAMAVGTAAGGSQGMRVPRPRGLRLPRQEGHCTRAAPAQGRQTRADRSAIEGIATALSEGCPVLTFFWLGRGC